MNTSKQIKIDPSWHRHLAGEFEKPYFKELSHFVHSEYQHTIVFPPPKDIFRAFDLCPFDNVEVVILGQDPYHGPGQANGLCFAVGEGIRMPPSLQNIFKEIQSDLGTSSQTTALGFSTTEYRQENLGTPVIHHSGDLERWARQGVLPLNATLTVRAHAAGSHQGKGWEQFTDAAVRTLSDEREHLVFILWGNYAKTKGAHIDRIKHLVLESAHPSPFSAYNGFFGNKHFSKTNEYLQKHGKKIIDWL